MSGMTPIPVDLALPQLGVALSDTAMAEVFTAAMRGYDILVESCRIERVKYRPRRNCTFLYELRLRNENGVFAQRVAARLCFDGDSAHRAAKAAARDWQPSAAGPAWLHLPLLDMITHWWPNDAKLGPTRLLADDDALVKTVLPEVVAALADRATLGGHRVEIVQYVPEHRVCARVHLRWRNRRGEEFERTLYAKADGETGGAVTHAVLRALERSPPVRAGRLRVPRSVLWQAAHGLHWQEALPGRALLDLQPTVAASAAASVGRQLAALHSVATPVERVVTPTDLTRGADDVAAVLGLVDSSWQPALTRLAAELAHGVAALAPEAVTLHGDLHPRNVLVETTQFAFIDLDSARRGPAVLDLGAWIADTLYRALLNGIAPARATESWQAFLAGYAAAGGEVPDDGVLAWATAYQLLCQRAWRCVVNLKPGRFALTPQLIALAEVILRAGTPAGTPYVSGNGAPLCATETA